MSVSIPTIDQVIDINKAVIENSSDPDDDKSLAGNFNNKSSLNFALNPPFLYETAFEAAYSIAKAIANDHVFSNGNKRTATEVVKKICADNGYKFNGDDAALAELVNSLVREDDDDYDREEEKQNFISKISEFF